MLTTDSEIAGKTIGPPQTTAKSSFQEPEDLERFGYAIHEGSSQPEDADSVNDFQSVLWTLGFTTGFTSYYEPHKPNLPEVQFGPNKCIGHEIVTPGRESRGKVGATMRSHFHQIVNSEDGLIMAIDNASPIAAYGGIGIPRGAVPPLKSWSDVAFLQWKIYTDEEDSLRYILRYNVFNSAT